jgi:hypothetical protein
MDRFINRHNLDHKLWITTGGHNVEIAEYDKIAAFIDLKSDEQFFAFLQVFQNEKLLVRWDHQRRCAALR